MEQKLDEIVMAEKIKIRANMYDYVGKTFDGKSVPLDRYEPMKGQMDLFEQHEEEFRPVQLYRLKKEYKQ
jgi:hypothetical protein